MKGNTEVSKSFDYPRDVSTINDSNFDHVTKIELKLDKNQRALTSRKQHYLPLRGFCSFLDRRIHNKASNPRSNRKATPPKIPPMMAPFPLDFPEPNHELWDLNWRRALNWDLFLYLFFVKLYRNPIVIKVQANPSTGANKHGFIHY